MMLGHLWAGDMASGACLKEQRFALHNDRPERRQLHLRIAPSEENSLGPQSPAPSTCPSPRTCPHPFSPWQAKQIQRSTFATRGRRRRGRCCHLDCFARQKLQAGWHSLRLDPNSPCCCPKAAIHGRRQRPGCLQPEQSGIFSLAPASSW